MGLPPSMCDFFCVDGAEIGAVNKAMVGGTAAGTSLGDIVLKPRPWLSGGVCTPHSLDLELSDIAKLPWIDSHLKEMRRCATFIRGHQYSTFLWREKAELEVLLPAETRFATNFIMAARLVKEKEAAAEMVGDRRYGQWLDGTLEGKKKGAKTYRAEGRWMKANFQDDDWWATGELILAIVGPIIELLRLADSEVPIMGKVYNRMFQIKQKLEDPTFAPSLEMNRRRAIVKIHTDRWEYLHNVYHAAGYALDPEFHEDEQHTNAEVMTGLRTVIGRLYHDDPARRGRRAPSTRHTRTAGASSRRRPSSTTRGTCRRTSGGSSTVRRSRSCS